MCIKFHRLQFVGDAIEVFCTPTCVSPIIKSSLVLKFTSLRMFRPLKREHLLAIMTRRCNLGIYCSEIVATAGLERHNELNRRL